MTRHQKLNPTKITKLPVRKHKKLTRTAALLAACSIGIGSFVYLLDYIFGFSMKDMTANTRSSDYNRGDYTTNRKTLTDMIVTNYSSGRKTTYSDISSYTQKNSLNTEEKWDLINHGKDTTNFLEAFNKEINRKGYSFIREKARSAMYESLRENPKNTRLYNQSLSYLIKWQTSRNPDDLWRFSTGFAMGAKKARQYILHAYSGFNLTEREKQIIEKK